MNKPQPKTKSALDYHECRDYINDKHNIDIDNYANWSPGDEGVPYQNYWHWLIDQCDVQRDSYFVMYDEVLEDLPEDDFKHIVTKWFFEEFGNGADSIEFWVEW